LTPEAMQMTMICAIDCGRKTGKSLGWKPTSP
jgi:hypothetical protein